MTLTLDFPECRDSVLGRLDPRWKLAALMPAAVAVALLKRWETTLTAFLGSLLLVWLVRLPLRWYLPRLFFTSLLLGLFFVWLPFLSAPDGETYIIGPVSISRHGLIVAATLLARALALVTLALVLTAASPLEDTLKAAHALHVPSLIVHLSLLAYRYVFLLAEELGRLRIALRVRGFRNRPNMHSYRTIGQVAGTLLVRGHDRAERIGQAMRCRGFDGVFRSLHEFSTTWHDVLTWLLVVSWAAGLVVWDMWIR